MILNGFFDSVLCLTQRERLDRQLQFEAEAKRVGLSYEYFYSIEDDNKFNSFCKSQKGLLYEFLQHRGERFLALEDDVVFKNTSHLEEALQELPHSWDIVYLGANLTGTPEKYSKHLFRVDSAWTTHAIGYSRKMIQWILAYYDNWNEGQATSRTGMYDDWLSREILPKFNCFVVAPMVAWQRKVYSDLWQRETEYGWQEIENKLI